MRYVLLSPALFVVLFGFARAAPCPGPMLEKRQPGLDDDLGDTLDTSSFDTAFGEGPGSGATDTWADPNSETANAAPVDVGADNLVGNNFAQIDDSTNIDNSSVEYPGDTQMTDNTGTAVSGNNNDIMPIINAPVTVIINSGDNKRNRKPPATGSRASPPASSAQPDGAPKLGTQQAAALSALASLPPAQLGQLLMEYPGLQQQLSFYLNAAYNEPDAPVSPIQRLVEYALAVSQSRF
ncbi:hypothetical protein LPJ59_004723 [Coemansia sp. RSA 2399]|nr:hypothetical protein LPJ59_004723 [Coemansia sp. RSA 2399]